MIILRQKEYSKAIKISKSLKEDNTLTTKEQKIVKDSYEILAKAVYTYEKRYGIGKKFSLQDYMDGLELYGAEVLGNGVDTLFLFFKPTGKLLDKYKETKYWEISMHKITKETEVIYVGD